MIFEIINFIIQLTCRLDYRYQNQNMQYYINQLPWIIVVILCLTLGLAPYTPQPHLIEKIILLTDGQLNTSVDIFDFLMHLSPFILLIIKTFLSFKNNAQ